MGIGLDTLRAQLDSLGKRLEMEQRVLATLVPTARIRAEIAARLRESVTA